MAAWTATSPRKYAALRAYLEALPKEQQGTTLTFAEIAALIHAPLPASVWSSAFWSHGTYYARTVWAAAGFTAQHVYHQSVVEFRRVTI